MKTKIDPIYHKNSSDQEQQNNREENEKLLGMQSIHKISAISGPLRNNKKKR